MERLHFFIALYGGGEDEEPRVVRSLQPIAIHAAGVRVLIMNHGTTERSAQQLSDPDINDMLEALKEGRPVFCPIRPPWHYTVGWKLTDGRLEAQVVQNDLHFVVGNATLYLIRPYRRRDDALDALPAARAQVGKVRQPRMPRGKEELLAT